jgi:hypothetical protein
MKEEGLEANPPGKTAERLPMNLFLARFYQIATLLPSLRVLKVMGKSVWCSHVVEVMSPRSLADILSGNTTSPSDPIQNHNAKTY